MSESCTTVTYERRVQSIVERSESARVIFPQWKQGKECWLFMGAHDDDVTSGASLTLMAGLLEGVDVYVGVSANGCMGYCSDACRTTIAEIRAKEAKDSYKFMGLKRGHLEMLNYDDCSFYRCAGRRFADENTKDPVIAGATGLQNSYVWLLRKVRPTRLFLPTPTDLHPDHQLTTKEMLISIFHAQGNIWPELGEPIPEIPLLYEYSCYSDFITPPTMRITVSEDLFAKKLKAIEMYKSQEQIEILIKSLREGGPQEYIRELNFDLMTPHKHDAIFD